MKTNLRKLLELVEDVVEREGCRCPKITWRFRDDRFSSGITYHEREKGILVTLGTDHAYARLVLLHEIAHYLTPEDRGHGALFWEVAMRLYREAGIGWGTIHRIECLGQGSRGYKGAHRAHRYLVSP